MYIEKINHISQLRHSRPHSPWIHKSETWGKINGGMCHTNQRHCSFWNITVTLRKYSKYCKVQTYKSWLEHQSWYFCWHGAPEHQEMHTEIKSHCRSSWWVFLQSNTLCCSDRWKLGCRIRLQQSKLGGPNTLVTNNSFIWWVVWSTLMSRRRPQMTCFVHDLKMFSLLSQKPQQLHLRSWIKKPFFLKLYSNWWTDHQNS